MKTCYRCKGDLTNDHFTKDKRQKDGLGTICRECRRSTRKKRLSQTRETVKRYRDNRHTLGLCHKCNNQLLPNSISVCEDHWYKSISHRNLKVEGRGPELKALAISQNYTCPYTGIKLIPALNMSLDHKVPRSKGGTDNLNNLQWVTDIANRMKWTQSESEFLAMCSLITQRS